MYQVSAAFINFYMEHSFGQSVSLLNFVLLMIQANQRFRLLFTKLGNVCKN